MAYIDYYKVMGVSKDASQEDIKRAYRKLARKYHPDVSQEKEAEARFKELGEAYAVLGDPNKRKKYDQFGEHWQTGGTGASDGGNGAYQGQTHSQAAFEDFLNEIFGQQRRKTEHHRPFYDEGEDIHAKLDVTLEESFHGLEKLLRLQTGEGIQTIKVKIPKGIGAKQQIRLKGQGGRSYSGKRGDLYIEINLLPHHFYRVVDKNIFLTVPIFPWEAALGTRVTVPTLGGKVELKIPSNAQTGQQLRLKGRGMPGTPPGDEMVVLSIVNPEKENAEMTKLYETMSHLCTENPRAHLRNLL